MPKKEAKTSLEDMMEDLQRAGQEGMAESEESKLVVRADGTQMMKVKKRKRRSEQPRKEEFKKRRRNRFALIMTGVALLFLAVLGAVIGMAYYNSKSFHGKVQSAVAAKSGAEVELGLLSVGADHADMDELSMTWPKDKGPIEYLKLSAIQANYNIKSLLGGGWNGTSIQAANGVLNLRSTKDADFGATTDGGLKHDFNYYRCEKLDVHVGGVKKVPLIAEADVTLKLPDVGRSQLNISGGVLSYPGFEELTIENGVLIFGEKEADMIMRLNSENQRGYISMEGKVSYDGAKKVSLSTQLEEYPMVHLLSDNTKRFFSANMTSESMLMAITLGNKEAMEAKGSFTASRFSIRDFQFLTDLSLVLGQKLYENPKFTKQASGDFMRVGNRLELSNLILEESTDMKITGSITVSEEGEISGVLRVGVPVGTANLLRDKVPEGMFSQPNEGYMWTDVQLGGTTASVSDDFSARLSKMKKPVIQTPSEVPKPAGEQPSFEELTE